MSHIWLTVATGLKRPVAPIALPAPDNGKFLLLLEMHMQGDSANFKNTYYLAIDTLAPGYSIHLSVLLKDR
jgi:hypothetical protein